jgi:Uma2 family endonuclease
MVLLNVQPPSVIKEIQEIEEISPAIIEECSEEEFAHELKKYPPTNLYSDEPPLETDYHREQIDLLIRLLKYFWRDRPDFYISGNLTVYYNAQKIKSRDFRGPDVFVVMDAEKKDRRSWSIWEEGGKYPNLVIELLSKSTENVDRGTKKTLYQDVWRVPNYFWFHPETLEFAGFHLVDGIYQAIAPTETGYLWSDQLELYLGIHQNQLRWFTADGELIPSAEERADRLEAILRSHGLNPD